MNDTEKTFLSCIGAFALIVILPVASSLIYGFVLLRLWEWFVVPTFGLPLLSLPVAVGISLIVSLLTISSPKTKDTREDSEKWVDRGVALIVPLLYLFFGWLFYTLL